MINYLHILYHFSKKLLYISITLDEQYYLEPIFLTIDVSCHLLLLSSASSPVPAMTLRNLKNLVVNSIQHTNNLTLYLGSKYEDHCGRGAQLDPQEGEKIFHVWPAVWEKDNTKA